MDHLNVSSITAHDERGLMGDRKVVTWILGLTFVTIINLSSILGALIVPFWTPGENTVRRHTSKGAEVSKEQLFATSKLHNGLEGLAFGSLLASSIFHLIPHAFDLIGQGKREVPSRRFTLNHHSPLKHYSLPQMVSMSTCTNLCWYLSVFIFSIGLSESSLFSLTHRINCSRVFNSSAMRVQKLHPV